MGRACTIAAVTIASFAALAIAPTPFTKQAAGQGYDPNYRYCTERGPVRFRSQTPDCRYTSMAQCGFSIGPGVRCIENPFYAPVQKARRRGAG